MKQANENSQAINSMKNLKLKALRQLKGLNQEKTAKILGISLHSYCDKENGKSCFTLEEAKKLSDMFGLTINEIFFTPMDFSLNTNVS